MSLASTGEFRWGILSLASVSVLVFEMCFLPASAGCGDGLSRVRIGRGEKRDADRWKDDHADLVGEAQRARKSINIAFYGDSITRAMAKAGALERYNQVYQSSAFGISGDTSSNLLYRVREGEFANGMAPKAALIMVGINDIRRRVRSSDETKGMDFSEIQEEADRIARDVEHMAAFIYKESCETQIILQAILPTADEGFNEWPNRYTALIDATNNKYREIASKYEDVHFLDCSGIFLEVKEGSNKQYIPESLMSDLLHPSRLGHELLTYCVLPNIRRIVDFANGDGKLVPPPVRNVNAGPRSVEMISSPAPSSRGSATDKVSSSFGVSAAPDRANGLSSSPVAPAPAAAKPNGKGYCSFTSCPDFTPRNPNMYCHVAKQNCEMSCLGFWCPEEPLTFDRLERATRF